MLGGLRVVHALLILVLLGVGFPVPQPAPRAAPPTAHRASLLPFGPPRSAHTLQPPAAPPIPQPASILQSRPARAPIAPFAAVPQHLTQAHLPLVFVSNRGQSAAPVRFLAHSRDGTLFFTDQAVTLALTTALPPTTPAPGGSRDSLPAHRLVRLRFDHARTPATLRPLDPLPGTLSIMRGADPAGWQTQLPTFGGVQYDQIYPGIDVRFGGDDGHLARTYTLAPGADPTRIRWYYEGAESIRLAADGSLQIALRTPTGPLSRTQHLTGTLTDGAPRAWQIIAGQPQPVAVRYHIHSNGSVGFVLGAYDATAPLTIDPTLDYLTTLGGSQADHATSVAVDAAGQIVLAGWTTSPDFPLPNLPPTTTLDVAKRDILVMGLDATGTQRRFTLLFGGAEHDYATAVALGPRDHIYVTGTTLTPADDLPLLNANPAWTTAESNRDGERAFLARFRADGTVEQFTTFGVGQWGKTRGAAVAVNASGAIYLAGLTDPWDGGTPQQPGPRRFPLANPIQDYDTRGGGDDAFVAKLTPDGYSVSYATFFGGTGLDQATGLALDAQGNAVVVGTTDSVTMTLQGPHAPPPVCGTLACAPTNGFVLWLSAHGGLVAWDYLGGTRDDALTAVAVDATGAAYAAGWTMSDLMVPPLGNPTTVPPNMLIVKLPALRSTAVYTAVFGGADGDWATSIAVDGAGEAVVVGNTYSHNLPLVNPIQAAHSWTARSEIAVARLATDGATLRFSTYLGGPEHDEVADVALTPTGSAVLVGGTESAGLAGTPTAPPAGGLDMFVAIIGAAALPPDQRRCPSCDDVGLPPQLHTPTPVNTRTGNYWTSAVDLTLTTAGPALTWARTYASQAITETASGLGNGWQHPYATRLITPTSEPGVLSVLGPTTNRERWTRQPDGSFRPWPGIASTLQQVGSTFVQTRRDQTQLTFAAASGQLLSIRDPHGRLVTLHYQATAPTQLDRVVDTADPSRALQLTWSGGHITAVSDGLHTVRYTYDAAGDLVTVRDVLDRPTTYQYTNHLLTHTRNALGQLVEHTVYDQFTPQGRVVEQTFLNGQRQAFAYLTSTTVLTTTGVDGRVDVVFYDYTAANTLRGVRQAGEALLASTFDAHFAPSVVTDGNGHTTHTTFRPDGLPTTSTDPLGQTTHAVYDDRANLVARITPHGVTTRWRYDAWGHVISQTVGITTPTPLGLTTLYTYTADMSLAGERLLTAQRTPDGVVTRYTYGTAPHNRRQVVRQEVGVGTPLVQTTVYTYDALGRLQDTTVGYGTPLARTDRTIYRADNSIAQIIEHYHDGQVDPRQPDVDRTTTFGYDALGRTVAVTDTLGRVHATHYQTTGQVAWTVANLTPLQFDAQGQPVLQPFDPARPDANVATFYGYDTLGRTVLVTETGLLDGPFLPATRTFSGTTTRVTRTDYDARSRPVTTTLHYVPGQPATAEQNLQTVTTYDGAGNVQATRDVLGRWTHYGYDARNQVVTTTVNLAAGPPTVDTNLVTVATYDALGRRRSTIANYTDGWVHPSQTITNLLTVYTYDALDRLVQTWVHQDSDAAAQGRSDRNLITSTRYDPLSGRLQGQADVLGRWTSYRYDALGRVVATVANCRDAAGQPNPTTCTGGLGPQADRNRVTATGYDALGRTVVVTDALGGATRTVYDGLGRTVAHIANAVAGAPTSAITNVTTLTAYDGLGRTTLVTDTLGQVTQYGHDALGRTTIITDVAGRVTRFGYDGPGVRRWVQQPDGQLTVFMVDRLGRVVRTIRNYQDGVADSHDGPDQDLVSTTQYDAAGRVTQTQDAGGRRTQFSYDARDRLISVAEYGTVCPIPPCVGPPPLPLATTHYHYDRAGNRIALTDANGHTRRFGYDALGRTIVQTDALGLATRFRYDEAGRLISQRDPRSATTPSGTGYDVTYTYDAADRPIRTTAGDPATLAPITRQYDALGRTLAMTDTSGTTRYRYDPHGQIAAVSRPDTGTVGYAYDALGRRTRLIYPGSGAPVLDYTYTPDGQLATVVQGAATLARYSYDAQGRLRQLARRNGAVTTYAYDGADRLRRQETSVAGQVVAGFQYTLNRAGERTQLVETLPSLPAPSRTQLAALTFEDHQVVAPVTGADTTTGSPQLETAAPLKGAISLRIPNAANSYVTKTISASGTLSATVALRLTQLPTDTVVLARLLNGGTALGNLSVTLTGTLLLRQGGTVVGWSPQPLVAGQTYRIGLHYQQHSGTPGVLRAWLAAGDAPFSGPAFGTTSYGQTLPVTQVQLGNSLPHRALHAVFDDLVLDTQTMPPPRSSRVRTASFEGAALIDAATGTDSVSSTVALEAARPLAGAVSARLRDAGGGLRLGLPHLTATYVSVALRLGGLPARPVTLLALQTGGQVGASLQLGTDGRLQLYAGTTAIGNPSAPLSLETDYRVGLVQRSESGLVQGWYTTGTASFTTAFASGTAPSALGTTTSVQVGGLTPSVPVDLVLDDLTVDSATLAGPPRSAPRRTMQYGYDARGRLTHEARTDHASGGTMVVTSTYDLAGNRTRQVYQWPDQPGVGVYESTYNAADQLTNPGYTYDAAGNLTSVVATTLSYDALGRLVARGATTYRYDGNGVLQTQVTDGTVISYTQDLAAPLEQVLQIQQDGTTTSYLYGLERLAAVHGSTRHWYASDGLGNVRRLLPEAGGADAPISYDAWGQVLQGRVPTFGFTGELQDAGLVYLRARWYTPGSGTFTSRDPFIGSPEQPYSLHPYQYAYSNPVLFSDPSGQYPQCLVLGLAGPIGWTGAGLCVIATQAAVAIAGVALGTVVACTGGIICPYPHTGANSGPRLAPAPTPLPSIPGVPNTTPRATPIAGPGTSAPPIPTPLPTPICEAEQLSTEQVREHIRAAVDTLVVTHNMQHERYRILYRGVNYNRAFDPVSGWLFLSESLYYATVYAHTDPVNKRIDPAVGVYIMLDSNFRLLRQSAQILTNRDYRARYSKGLPPIHLDQENSSEWVLSPAAQGYLFGPAVIRIPTSFRG